MPASQYCARPGCSGSTAAWLTYDYEVRTVWLDDRDSGVGGSRLGLCATHGDRLKVPLGWIRRDRRTAARPAPDLARLVAPQRPDGPAHRSVLSPDAGSPAGGEDAGGRDNRDSPADGPEGAPSPSAVAV